MSSLIVAVVEWISMKKAMKRIYRMKKERIGTMRPCTHTRGNRMLEQYLDKLDQTDGSVLGMHSCKRHDWRLWIGDVQMDIHPKSLGITI